MVFKKQTHVSSSLLDLKIQYCLKFLDPLLIILFSFVEDWKVCKQLILESQYAFK